MKLTKKFLAAVLVLASAAAANAMNLSATGDSEFVATGKPGFIKIHGIGSGLTGKFVVAGTKISGEAEFPLDALNTGVNLRDKHMKTEYLETQKFPLAKMVINALQLASNPIANGFKANQVPFQGTFVVHGVSHPVTGTIDLDTESGVMKGEANFDIKISDFGFRDPKYMGMRVNDDVQVKVHLQVKKASAG